MIEIIMPDGSVAEFPDGTPQDVIIGAVNALVGTQRNEDGTFGQPPEGSFVNPNTGQITNRELLTAAQSRERNRFDAVTSGAAQGVTFGLADEIAGLLSAANPFGRGTMSERFAFGRERARAATDADRQNFPVTSLLSELGGALSLPIPAIAAGGTLPARVGRSALTGGLLGGAFGFNAGEGGARERLESATTGALAGAATGAAVPVVLNAGVNAVNRARNIKALNNASRSAPSADDLRTAAQRAFTNARNTGAVVLKDRFQSFSTELSRRLNAAGIDDQITPKAAAALRRINSEAGKNIGLDDLDKMRRIANNASISPDPNERRLAGAIVRELDDFVLNLVDDDLVRGTTVGLSRELEEARRLWGALRRSERLERVVSAARDAASGFENGLRIEARKVLKDQTFMRSLNDAERQAIREISRGSLVGNTLRRIGRLSFGKGQQSNFLGGSIGVGAGATLGGTVGAVAAPLIGRLAADAAERSTLSAAQRARNVLAIGGVQLPPPLDTRFLDNALRNVGLLGAIGATEAMRSQ